MTNGELVQSISSAKRIVVKVGSAVLSSMEGGLHTEHIDEMVDSFARVLKTGRELVLVSSGAIAAGSKEMGMEGRPSSIPEKQAAAAVGQARLMWVYERCFRKKGLKVAQILLTRDDLSNRHRFLNARNTMFTLLRWGVVPVINENDSVVTEEIQFGDNDRLSALVTNLVQADLLVMLTDTDGIFEQDPKINPSARKLSLIEDIDETMTQVAWDSKSELGTGGMHSKLLAAKTASLFGVPTVVGNGKRPDTLEQILRGEDVGTVVLPKKNRLTSWKHWIAFSKRPAGSIVVDEGAKRAIVEKGKSLLPSGIKSVLKDFEAGDSVRCLDENGVEFARGLVNYSSRELEKIKGKKTTEIESILGYKYYDEIIHRDDLVLMAP
jgi:glutamate 5-kinase